MDKIEIPFGAYDSETLGWTYTIPKGYTAKIEDGKIIVKKEELEDERIRKWIYNIISSLGDPQDEDAEKELEEMQPLALAYLEKQKPVQLEEEKEYIRTLKSRIADFLRGKDKDEVDITYYQRICDWLDGRHVEQKPSEEQMCYLKKVYESYDFCDGERDALESLYNDLKKLM